MIALLLALGCTSGPTEDAVELAPEPIGLAECDVCGMVVGEQPSPRGQVAYRDGTHVYTCSIEEARALAATPDARGRPVGVWVEALPAGFDWTTDDVAQLPWVAADEAHFVYGAERKRVMGVAVLSYAASEDAAMVADTLGTTPVTWTDLLQTPVPAVPEAAGWTPPDHRSQR